MPITKSRFERILLTSNVLTIATSPCARATIDKINSMALLRASQQNPMDIKI